MECNKEEAMRAKLIAEKKMRSNDFEGARKIALKAKHLDPELENINQILSICDVYCSAQIRLARSVKDWYGILQVEKLADVSTIKKQYRRLALVLHPDKNRFPSSEGAFKLVCEANAVLSDPAKKSPYDNKIKILANPPNHLLKRNHQFNKQYTAQNDDTSNSSSSKNQHQATQSSIFWTCCRCLQRVYKLSAPHANIGHQGVPSKPNVRQRDVFQEKAKVPSMSHAGSQGTANMKIVQPQPGAHKRGGSDSCESIKVASAAENLKTNETVNLNASSSRRRHHVSIKDADEDDGARPLKRAHTTKEADEKEHNAAVDGEDHSKHSFPTDSGSSDQHFIECPYPEFSNFDMLRVESQFHVNQFWACYDTTSDSMPRFYAKVRKVRSSPFELRITWLEAVPIDDSWEKWVEYELPVGCGSFKLGQTDKVSGCLSLSHQVHCEKGKKRDNFFIYPREGEVWALYRDWDISWSSNTNPKNHKKFRYEIVEVLSDYAAGVGIKVVYMDKCTGFVSLFRRAVASSFFIKPTEVYKFSHCVPSFKLTGAEREGVPIGSFELDPASLPLNPDDLYFPSKAKIESRD